MSSEEYYHIPREQLDRIEKEVDPLKEEGANSVKLFVYEAIERLIIFTKKLRIEKERKNRME